MISSGIERTFDASLRDQHDLLKVMKFILKSGQIQRGKSGNCLWFVFGFKVI